MVSWFFESDFNLKEFPQKFAKTQRVEAISFTAIFHSIVSSHAWIIFKLVLYPGLEILLINFIGIFTVLLSTTTSSPLHDSSSFPSSHAVSKTFSSGLDRNNQISLKKRIIGHNST